LYYGKIKILIFFVLKVVDPVVVAAVVVDLVELVVVVAIEDVVVAVDRVAVSVYFFFKFK
jgi:hypothetical protein